MEEDLVEVQYSQIAHETAEAICLEVVLCGEEIDNEVTVWVPKSLIMEENPKRNIIKVPDWFAKKEGLV